MKMKKIYCYILVVAMCVSYLQLLPQGVKTVSAAEDMIFNLKFDGDLIDSSGNSNDGQCTYGKITYEDGIFGKCAVFDGKSYVEVPDADILDLKDNFTISLWAYKEKMKDNFIPYVYKEEDEISWAPPYKLYEHSMNTPTIYLHDGDCESELNQFYVEGEVIDIRQWFLLTVTYNGTEVRLYHNNRLTKRISVTGVPANTVGDLYIGMLEGSSFFKGKMDDLRIYNRALSADDIGSLYNKGLQSANNLLKQTNAMVAHYKFENNFKDSTKMGNDAEKVTGEGSIKFVEAMNGKGAKFTKGSYLEVKDDDSLNFDESFSFTGWICVSKSEITMPILNRLGVSTSASSNDTAYKIYAYDAGYEFHYVPFAYQSSSDFSSYSMEKSMKNKWVHIAVTFTGDEIRWYKNGALVKKEEIDGIKIAHAGGNLMIGSDGDNFLEGTLDELKIYNYTLGANEVKADAVRIDSIFISKDNEEKIKALKVKGTVAITTSRKYVESGDMQVLSTGVTFTSSNKKIFTVSKDGKITAVKKGSAKLTVTHGGISKTYAVTVK